MEKQPRKKITWTIKNSSSLLRSEKIFSDQFVVGGCKWRLCAYPKGSNFDYLFLFLEVADYKSLPLGWRRQARYLLNLVNQNSVKRSKQNEMEKWFDEECPRWGFLSMFPMNEINARDSGFLVNGELKVVADVQVLRVIGKLDVSEETSTITETIDVKGFHLLSSQVKFVSHMFERHPEVATEFSAKNPNIRAGYMNLLLSLIETSRQSLQELRKADLEEAFVVLRSMTDAGFKLDWLEKRLDEMFENKEKEEDGETRMQLIEEELKDLKQKCSDLEDQLEKEKEEVSAFKRRHISFDAI